MIDLSQVTCLVADYGSFLNLAARLGDSYKRVLFYSPYEQEFRTLKRCCIGTGLENVERCDEFMDPSVLKEINLFCFPDIGYGGLQRYLRSIGKAVWGSMGGSDLELYRDEFLETLKKIGLPVAPSKVIKGLTALRKHLEGVKDKWIKVNRYRADMETWRHIDYEHSLPMLNSLAVEWGGLADTIVFVVQDPIEHAQEVGYDGYCVDGKFPSRSYQGYEKKNELYLGSWLDNSEMPEQVLKVNDAMSPILRKMGYRNFFASEIRGRYFIDPTARMAGQTMEHAQETCTNLPEIIWAGANGVLVEPKFDTKFAAEATLHYKQGTDDWMVMRLPPAIRRWVKMYYYCQVDGVYWFPPHKSDEVGVVLGNGDSVEDAIDHLQENLEALKGEPVEAEVGGFVELLEEITEAQKKGIKFSDKKLPRPVFALGE